MPQPPRPPEPEAPEQDAPDTAADDAAAEEWAALVDAATEEDSSASRQIKRAITLEADRASIMREVSDNREYLRLMHRNKELNEDQVEFVETFYPEKERGSRRDKTDIEATRRAREAARKSNGSA